MGNLKFLCGHCNSLKGDGTMSQLRSVSTAKGTTKPDAMSRGRKTQARRPVVSGLNFPGDS